VTGRFASSLMAKSGDESALQSPEARKAIRKIWLAALHFLCCKHEQVAIRLSHALEESAKPC